MPDGCDSDCRDKTQILQIQTNPCDSRVTSDWIKASNLKILVLIVFFMVAMTLAGEWVAVRSSFAATPMSQSVVRFAIQQFSTPATCIARNACTGVLCCAHGKSDEHVFRFVTLVGLVSQSDWI